MEWKKNIPHQINGDENYLDVLGIELVDGTGFSETLSATQKVPDHQSFARLFPNQDLIGRGIPGWKI